jgi:hypothetical protein
VVVRVLPSDFSFLAGASRAKSPLSEVSHRCVTAYLDEGQSPVNGPGRRSISAGLMQSRLDVPRGEGTEQRGGRR